MVCFFYYQQVGSAHKILVGWAKMYFAPLIIGVYIRDAWSVNYQENDIA